MTGEQHKPGHPETGHIIDAAARKRPRVRSPEADRKRSPSGLEFLADVPLKVSIVLAHAVMPLGEILALGTDSVVQLDRPSGDPVDIYVGNQRLGKGEVIVLQEKLRIRILEISAPLIGSISESSEEE
jgi:flagellar motor switch protein FliN/FliY